MKLKMIKTARVGQQDMVCNTKYGTRVFALGETLEISEEEGAEILAGKFGKCYERVEGDTKPPLVGKAKAVSVDDAAAEEATKAATATKDYKTK